MDWLSREEGRQFYHLVRDRHRDELRETVDQFRLTASKMGKAVLIANATAQSEAGLRPHVRRLSRRAIRRSRVLLLRSAPPTAPPSRPRRP